MNTRFSSCRKYRYALWREWIGGNGYAMFVGLNPSTADETRDDATIRRCIAFAKGWGYEALCMTNLFAWRATKPADMLAIDDPVGPDNNATLIELAVGAGVIVAAWGAVGTYRGRDAEVCALLPALHCLHLTRGGQPGHPLYLPAALSPLPWPGIRSRGTSSP